LARRTKRAGEGDALLLTAGELARLARQQLIQTQQLGNALDVRANGLPRRAYLGAEQACPRHPLGRMQALQKKRHRDVLEDRQMRIERIGLKHQRDVALRSTVGGDIAPVDADHALVGRFQSGKQAQRGGFAAARRADQRHELPGLERQRNLVHCRMAAEALGDLVKGK
jgi:hypothetical protein